MKVSVITVCLNNEELENTINSVIQQTCNVHEHLIIDGKSENQATVNTLLKFKGQSGITIISENDNGIYDAMNKGIRLSTGDYVIFLNAGDTFYNNESIRIFEQNHDGFDVVYGNLEIQGEVNYLKKYPSKLSFGYFLNDTLPHPATFLKRDLFEKVGNYDAGMLISADWAFFLEAVCLHNVNYKHLPYTISSFQDNGISSLPKNQGIINQEKMRFLELKFSSFIQEYSQLLIIKEKFHRLENSRARIFFSFFFKGLRK